MIKKLFAIIFGVLFMTSCTQAQPLLEGGLYAMPKEKGKYLILKVLKLDEHGVHVRLYSNVFDAIPEKIDEASLSMAGLDRKPNEELGMGHVPVSNKSFKTWGAIFVQQSTVSKEELEGYQVWLEAKGGYF